jgi:ABC-type uncharacterized transport system YnjBCD substrate-binding protein
MAISRRNFISGVAVLLSGRGKAMASDWASIEAEAKGQTVYFNAWAGSDPINAYIKWAGDELKTRHGVILEHVKITDTAEVVKRVRDEIAAGKQDGSVDLVWINGENFRAMKNDKLHLQKASQISALSMLRESQPHASISRNPSKVSKAHGAWHSSHSLPMERKFPRRRNPCWNWRPSPSPTPVA